MWNSRNVGGADWHNIAERGGGRKKSIRRQTQDPTRLIGLVKPCDVAEAEPLTSDRISAVKQELLLKTSLRMRLPVLILHKLLTIWDWEELERRYWFTILQRRWRRAVSEVFKNQSKLDVVSQIVGFKHFQTVGFCERVVFEKWEMLMLIPILASVSSSDYLVTLITRWSSLPSSAYTHNIFEYYI